MSLSQSETETLLPSEVFSHHLDSADQDRPVKVDDFKRNVKICKAVLGLVLPVTLALEIWNLVLSSGELAGLETRDRAIKAAIVGQVWIDGLGTAAITCLAFLYVAALFRTITIRTLSLTPEIQHASLHRALCQLGFSSTLFLIGLHAVPGIAYTIITHLSPPTLSAAHGTLLRHLRTAALVATLLAVGLMRRGPKLYFPPPRLGTGFGLSNEKEEKEDEAGEDERVVIKLTPAAEEADPLASAVTIGQQQHAIPSEPASNVFDYDNSAMLVFVVIGYMAPLAVRSAYVDSLQQSDLPMLEDRTRNSGIDDSVFSADRKDEAFIPENKIGSWQLVKLLWAGKGWTVFISFALETTRNLISFIQIAAMHEIIDSFNQPAGSDKSYAYLMCWALFFGQVINVLLSAYCCVRENYMLHVPVRMSLSSMAILRTTDAKALEAHNVDVDDKTQDNRGRSQVMNLLSIDANTVASLATRLWDFANGMTTLVIGTGMLYKLFGVSAFVGIVCVPLSTPLSWLVSKLIYKCDKEWMRARDARTGALKEFLLGIKVIKLNAWEPYFGARVAKLRAHEVKWQRWRFTLGTAFNVLADQLPVLSLLITFWFHTKVMGNSLDAATAFVALSIFGRVKDGLQAFPQVLQNILTSRVCLGRLSRFLSQPEIDADRWQNASRRISANGATITWPAADGIKVEESGRFKLRDVDLRIPEGKLSVLCGPRGAGKTLLLRAFLGEAKVENGTVFAPRSLPDATPVLSEEESTCIQWTTEMWLNDSVAYAPQQSFIRHGTIRDNILFGQPMWEERYREAMRQAALMADLDMFGDGDLTEVGENGVTLSGGQKARVNLARCLYSRASTIYLDDILSAVDAHTAQYIFAECLQGGLLENRTTILVTHHVRLVLPAAAYIISLTKDGKVDQACSTSDVKLGELELEDPPTSPSNDEDLNTRSNPQRKLSVKQSDKQAQSQDVFKIPRASRQLYREEHREVGRVSRNHYFLIFRAAGGKGYWTSLFLIFGGLRAITICRSFWLEHWSADPSPEHLNYNLAIYTIIVFFSISVGAFRWIWLYGVKNVGFYSRGSRLIHDVVMERLFSAPLQFFETTPQGRILNVFGQDIWRLDSNSADAFGRDSRKSMRPREILSLIIVCQAVALITLIFGIPLYWVSGHVNKLRSDIRRLTATASSPLYSLYNEAIDGVVMVRAFGQNKLLMATMKTLNNRERVAWVANWWVSAMVRSVTSVVITATGLLLVGQNISASQAGLILSFASLVSSGLFNLMEQYSQLEQTFVSAERVNYYINMPDHETEEGAMPPKEWPTSGKIEVQDLSVRYASDLPTVLNNVSFSIEPGHRVGLVGATGSGKSTLALALFRAVGEQEGRILIDGVDTSTVLLPELRKRLNMVAQDGILCSGSLRESLDVTGQRTDSEIYEALRKVHLISGDMTEAETQENPFTDLDTYVAIEGANFSQGQRQLLCLARALLKDSKILVMDEATSSVDFATDAKITATIKECFSGITMLVIAHRLATVMSYDRILVLDKGQIVEEGKPEDLIRDHTSRFYGLCMAQGIEEYNSLLAMVSGEELN
ncbi:ATP-dependent bile acid transporter [Cryptococcus wingfieldii CBS 7118]|uniref:ATP-dependent bile acid transporter n=1 Tax=Cryptococcus wingfieldii CBS 7118 TaxID=1295528 RepID=A0A1E3K653_9TREE|nr:ATP-dependent bile acid transporter [Cryptococcus wingfieldii CBS 7118]ODO08343.1 ATP-dependent bile acid transporter [Cryptococcus wingfieldii CBS 7118]